MDILKLLENVSLLRCKYCVYSLLCDFLKDIISGESFETVGFLVTWYNHVGCEWHSVVILERNSYFAFQVCVLTIGSLITLKKEINYNLVTLETEGQDEHIALGDRALNCALLYTAHFDNLTDWVTLCLTPVPLLPSLPLYVFCFSLSGGNHLSKYFISRLFNVAFLERFCLAFLTITIFLSLFFL